MVRYVSRSGADLNWDDAAKSADFFPESAIREVYGKADVIDIILLGGWNGVFYSVSPYTFTFEVGQSTGNSTSNYSPNCQGDANQPIQTKYLERNKLGNLSAKALAEGAGAWHNNGDEEKQLDKINNMGGINLEAIKTLDDRKGKTTNPWQKCTEFAILFSRVSEMSDAVFRGYEFFEPNDFTNRRNWISYDADNNTHDNFLLVMYLTKPKFLLQNKFLQAGDPPSAIKQLMKTGIAADSIINLVNDSCTASYPQFSKLDEGTYPMGTTIYSPNSEYKLIVQPDGNVVSYKGSTPIWSSGTFSIDFIKPKLIIGSNGEVKVRGAKDYTIVSAPNKKAYLSLDNSGILLLRDYTNNDILWSSYSGSKDVYNDYFQGHNGFAHNKNYSANGVVRYSPNMKYYLIFRTNGKLSFCRSYDNQEFWSTPEGGSSAVLSIQKDGNVVIYKSNKLDTITDNAVWNTGTFGFTGLTFLAADDSGHVVLYGNDGGNMKVLWSTAGKESETYYTLYGGLKSKNLNTISPFDRPCTNSEYNKSINKQSILNAQATYCSSGLRLIDDPRCNKFTLDTTVTPIVGDSGSAKDITDDYVKKIVCANGYDTKFSDFPDVQDKVNKFCKCVNPSGDTQKLYASSNVHPKCFDLDCVNSGYKSRSVMSVTCPLCTCIQNMDLYNLTKATDIKQTCSNNCTRLDAPPAVASTTEIVFNTANVFNYKNNYNVGTKVLSPNERYSLDFQTNGNLVLKDINANNTVLWESKTSGNTNAVLYIQTDGIAGIYRSKEQNLNTILWATSIYKFDGDVFLAPDNNGNAVLYGKTNSIWKPIWASCGLDKYTPNTSITIQDGTTKSNESSTTTNTGSSGTGSGSSTTTSGSSTTPPSPTTPPPSTPPAAAKKGLSGVQIAAIVCSIIAVLLFVVIIFVVIKKRNAAATLLAAQQAITIQQQAQQQAALAAQQYNQQQQAFAQQAIAAQQQREYEQRVAQQQQAALAAQQYSQAQFMQPTIATMPSVPH